MLLKKLMEKKTPNPQYTGWVTNDDNVFAIGLTKEAQSEDYAVVQMGIEGLDSQMNPTTSDKTYLRAGQSSLKTGAQRTFKTTGDRYIGDEAQDLLFSHEMKYGTGNACIVPYVYFNILTGKGEQGQVSVVVNSDGSGNAGESAGIDVEFKKVGANPAEYTWTKPSEPTQPAESGV